MKTTEEKLNELNEKWINERKYDPFVYDGILNFQKWNKSHPKILFLLKETADDFTHIANSKIDIRTGNGPHFWWNIVLWKYAINKIFNNEDASFPNMENIPEVKENNYILDSIAYVNVKKTCDNYTTSSDSDIIGFANHDKDFLIQQINLINPNIIISSKLTFNCYKTIYQIEPEYITDICYNHNDRLILKYKHPSFFQISGGRETLYYGLCEALKEKNGIMNIFSWV